MPICSIGSAVTPVVLDFYHAISHMKMGIAMRRAAMPENVCIVLMSYPYDSGLHFLRATKVGSQYLITAWAEVNLEDVQANDWRQADAYSDDILDQYARERHMAHPDDIPITNTNNEQEETPQPDTSSDA